MRTHHMIAGAVVVLGALTLAACGGGSYGAAPKQAVPVTIAMSTAVKSGDTSLGKVLVVAVRSDAVRAHDGHDDQQLVQRRVRAGLASVARG